MIDLVLRETFRRIVDSVRQSLDPLFRPKVGVRAVTELLSWGVPITLVTFCVAGAFSILGTTEIGPDEFWIARGCFVIAGVISIARIVLWGYTTSRGLSARLIIGGLIIGASGILTVEAIRYVNRKHTRWLVAHSTPPASLPKPESAIVKNVETKELAQPKVQPNLVFLRVDEVLVYFNQLYKKIVKWSPEPRSAEWRRNNPAFRILVAYYRNEPTAGNPPGAIKNLSAELTYETGNGPYVVPRGEWFPQNDFTVNIPYNDSAGILLAEHHQSETIYGRNKHDLVTLGERDLTVVVRLFSGTDGSVSEGGKFKIESVKTDNGFAFRATKVD